MNIALIGPGYIPIPPPDHGAVEIVVWNLAQEMQALGHKVTIYNDPDLQKVVNDINQKQFDFVHLQYENHARYVRRFLHSYIPYAVTCHYGLILQQQAWDPGYHHIIVDVIKSQNVISLSKEIQSALSPYLKKQCSHWLRNGAEFNKFKCLPQGNGRAICLGKIEPRKGQTQMNTLCGNIDFVGPKAIDFTPTEYNRYLGTWSKQQVYDKLTEYNTLVLLSYGEAAPLVVPEAFAAGLNVVISRQAAANIPPSLLKYTTILDISDFAKQEIPQAIYKAINQNVEDRNSIRDEAYKYFDWSVIAKDYEQIIRKIIRDNQNSLLYYSNQ